MASKKVKRNYEGASDSVAAADNVTVQRKLRIGAVNDQLEHNAETTAETVMNIPDSSLIQRKCSSCEEEDKVQRKPLPAFIQKTGSDSGTLAGESVSGRINSTKGGGSSLDNSTKSFMESRFGTDFSDVKIHTGDYAVQMSQELNAEAFTVGNDVYFNYGKYNPSIYSGKHLLAHELAHTIQQGSDNNRINRKLKVNNPADLIPNPTGKGAVQTNRDTVQNYLTTICPGGFVNVSPAGEVSIPDYFCSDTKYPPDFIGPIPPTASKSATPVGCRCLCDMVTSANSWRITVDDSSWPHTSFDNNTDARTPGSGGTGGEVTTPSPNSPNLWGAVTASGAFADIDPWLVLGHELCGHGWLGDKGEAGKDDTKPRGKGGHQETVERENLLRDEHGIERRGTFRQPYCGESFSHPVGTAATLKTVTMSSFLAVCEQWRKDYNKLNGTSFKISDTIPVVPGEKLPP